MTVGARFISVKNTSNAAIAPRSIVMGDGMAGDNLRTLTVKTSDKKDTQNVLVTGEIEIPSGGYGLASADFPLWARFTGDTPAPGDTVGLSRASGADLGSLVKGAPGFRVLAVQGSLVLVLPSLFALFPVKAKADISIGASGNIIETTSGGGTEYGAQYSAVNHSAADAKNGDLAVGGFDRNGLAFFI